MLKSRSGSPLTREAAANKPANTSDIIPRRDSNCNHCDSSGQRFDFVLTATPCQRHHAQLVATARTRGHDHTRKPSEDLGAARNAQADYFSSLAEIVIVDAMERAGLNPHYVLLADRPPREPDLLLGNRRIEIKSVLPGKLYACVNARQHEEKKPDTYLIACFLSPDRLLLRGPIAWSAVSQWRLMTHSHSPYRSILASTIPVLTDWQTLLEGETA